MFRKYLDLLENASEEMETFYHGTSKAKVPGIMAHGLDPKESQYGDDEARNWSDEDAAENPPEPYTVDHQFVYLASERYAKAHSNQLSDAVILKVTVPKSFAEKYFVYHRGEYTRCPVLIPPKYISIN